MREKDILISQFIDNELTLEEKAEFVREINVSDSFCAETLDMLDTEMLMEGMMPDAPPVPEIKEKKRIVTPASLMSFTALAASLAVALKVFLFAPSPVEEVDKHRFVVYVPDAQKVSVTGSFSQWQSIDMKPVGNGYWHITLPLKKGEYVYNYVVDENKKMPDPAAPAKQIDDFGGENSVLMVGDNI